MMNEEKVIVYSYHETTENPYSDGISDFDVTVSKYGLIEIIQGRLGKIDTVTLLIRELFDICHAVDQHFEKNLTY